MTLKRCAAQVISSFVIFAVLDLRVGDVVLKRRCKLLSFFTIIIISDRTTLLNTAYTVGLRCGTSLDADGGYNPG